MANGERNTWGIINNLSKDIQFYNFHKKSVITVNNNDDDDNITKSQVDTNFPFILIIVDFVWKNTTHYKFVSFLSVSLELVWHDLVYWSWENVHLC